jgi:hypothetical protein
MDPAVKQQNDKTQSDKSKKSTETVNRGAEFSGTLGSSESSMAVVRDEGRCSKHRSRREPPAGEGYGRTKVPENSALRFTKDSSAGTRTPDTRIMIPL